MTQTALFQSVLIATIAAFTFASAQPSDANTVHSVRADLDRDGRAETFQLLVDGQSSEPTLTITRPGKPTITVPSIVWSLEPASLSRASNGSILLNSSHMGIGRSAHEQTLTIAFRNGAYQVVGITRSAWDKLNPEAATRCDINLLTGRGIVNNRAVRRAAGAVPVTAWHVGTALPAGCETR
jgi:hypothetical protein